MHYDVPSTVVQIQGSHYSISRPQQLMPSSHHHLRCCTTTRYVPPHHPASTTLIQQPSKFKSTLRTKPNPMLMSAPSNYTGQPINTFETMRKMWIPTTVVHVLPKDAYQVCIANRTIYHCPRHHLWECTVRCSLSHIRTRSHHIFRTCGMFKMEFC